MSADAALPLAPAEHVAEVMALQADLHCWDTNPDRPRTSRRRLLAMLEAHTCPCCAATS